MMIRLDAFYTNIVVLVLLKAMLIDIHTLHIC